MSEYDKDPKLAIRNPKLLRDLKIAASVLGDDEAPRQPQINLIKIQQLIQQNLADDSPAKVFSPIDGTDVVNVKSLFENSEDE